MSDLDPPCPNCGHLATYHDGHPCDAATSSSLSTPCGCLTRGVDITECETCGAPPGVACDEAVEQLHP